MDGPHAYQLGTFGVAAVAAVFDWRTGRIPNWLTLGALLAAFPLHAWMTASAGPEHQAIEGLKWALFGMLVCAIPMVIGWRLGWVAGGDVKLVAAMGAIGGLSLGLEAIFLSLLAAASFLILRFAWNGTLFQTLGDTVTMTVGRTLRRRRQADRVVANATTLRFGPFAVIGSGLSIMLHGGALMALDSLLVTPDRPLGRRGPIALLGDDRGVIMVVGVFFSLLLIGLCWFIFGVGNAIAYRENLQNASDSAAFAAAVYDARGMNLLAMMNIIMGVILATLVVAKFVEIAAVISDLTTCNDAIDATEDICAIEPFALPACIASAGATALLCVEECKDIKSWQSKLTKYDTGVHDALKVLHDAEVGIAVGWPWIAAGKSGNVQFYYKDSFNLKNGAAVTTSFAYSQIPWNLDGKTGSLLSGDPSESKDAPNPPQNRYGLPVTSDTYADLCIADFNDLTTLGGVIGTNPISKFMSQAFDWFSQWFCDDATGSSAATDIVEGAPALIAPQAVAVCAIGNVGDIKSALGKKNGKVGAVINAVTPLPMSMTFPGVDASTFTYSPMALFPKAKMGLDYFGVWSTAIGDYDDTLSSSRVQIAGQQGKSGSKVVSDPTVDVPDLYVGVSKAEFYYDAQKSDTVDKETKMTTANQPLDVMWNMRWRARLRRYHYFPGADGIGDKVIDLMNTGFANVASAAVTALLSGKNPLTELVGPEVSVDTLPTTGAPTIFH